MFVNKTINYIRFIHKPDEDLQYIGRKFVNKTIALKNFKINNHQDVSRVFNILHYNEVKNYCIAFRVYVLVFNIEVFQIKFS